MQLHQGGLIVIQLFAGRLTYYGRMWYSGLAL